jgi:hypothetical protein
MPGCVGVGVEIPVVVVVMVLVVVVAVVVVAVGLPPWIPTHTWTLAWRPEQSVLTAGFQS